MDYASCLSATERRTTAAKRDDFHSKSLFHIKNKGQWNAKSGPKQRMGILLCEHNFWDVWIRNESVRAEIGHILHTDTHPHTHTHTHTHTHNRGKISSKDVTEQSFSHQEKPNTTKRDISHVNMINGCLLSRHSLDLNWLVSYNIVGPTMAAATLLQVCVGFRTGYSF